MDSLHLNYLAPIPRGLIFGLLRKLMVKDGKVQFSLHQPNFEESGESSSQLTKQAVAPMPGVLDKLLVKPGDVVKAGDPLFILIAMKMEYIVKATREAKVDNIFFKAGDSVAKDATIVQFEE